MKVSVEESDRTTASSQGTVETALLHVRPRPGSRVELALRVKNEEATLPERLRRAARLLGSLEQSSSIVIVDCGSVDHSVDVALSLTGHIPVYVISCSETAAGWMAAAASTSAADTIAFAAGTERLYLLAHTRVLVGKRALVVAVTEETPHFHFVRPPIAAWRARSSLSPVRIELLHMDTGSAVDLFAAEPGVSTLDDVVERALGCDVAIRELRIYEPPTLRWRPAAAGGWRGSTVLR